MTLTKEQRNLVLTKQLLLINLRSARELICNEFCTKTQENTTEQNDAHCFDCSTLLRLIQSYN